MLLFNILLLSSFVTGQQSFDCGLRNLSLHFARIIQPSRPSRFLSEIADALLGSPQFGGGPDWCKVDDSSTIMMKHNSTLIDSLPSRMETVSTILT